MTRRAETAGEGVLGYKGGERQALRELRKAMREAGVGAHIVRYLHGVKERLEDVRVDAGEARQ